VGENQKDLVRWWQYWPRRLSLLPRLPVILKTAKHVANISAENRESWGRMLEDAAVRFPDSAAVKSEEGQYSWRAYNQETNAYANYFISQGLTNGDTAAVFLENRPELLMVYSAVGKVGAVNAMINTNLRLDALRHCLTLNPAKMFIVGEEVLDAFEAVKADLDLGAEQRVYLLADKGRTKVPDGYIDLGAAIADADRGNPPTTAAVTPDSPLAYVFTSGTTGGRPKAAVIMHKRVVSSAYYNGRIILNMDPSHTLYVPLPFFHTNALALSWPSVFVTGAAVAIRRKFSVRNFWSDVRKYNATAWCYIGELCRYLMNQPPQPDDRDNPLTKIIGNGLRPDIWRGFKKRFNISKVYEIYGAAESNLYFVNMLNLDATQGTCKAPYSVVKYDVEADAPVRGSDGFMQKAATRTVCPAHCGIDACGILAHVKGDRVVKVEPAEFPDPKLRRICLRGLSSLDITYHPERLRYPMRRVGERGEGKFERISWDEALDFIAHKFKQIAAEYGWPAIAWVLGGPGSGTTKFGAYLRLASLTQSTRVSAWGYGDAGLPCGSRIIFGTQFPYGLLFGQLWSGSSPEADMIVVWGANPGESQPLNLMRPIMNAKAGGARLVVIDPRYTVTASKADQYIGLKPGTDTALALGLMHVSGPQLPLFS
jgi:acyl-CoA synthetase (AMP-forming)/AMP-acid ligase II